MSSNKNPQYIPWTWKLRPIDTTEQQCPSVHHTVLVYLVATLATTILAVGIGHRKVVHVLTCTRFGRKHSTSWTYLWILPLCLHLGADFLNAYLATHAPGYNANNQPKVWELALFYSTRPRMAWILLSLLGIQSYWSSAAKQIMIVEIIMQLVGCYYLGSTAHFAARHGYFSSHGYNHWAQLLYGSALATLIFTVASMYGLLTALITLAAGEREKKEEYEMAALIGGGQVHAKNNNISMRLYLIQGFGALVLVSCGLFAFFGRLMFLVGYLELAGENFCPPPPRLILQGLIWVAFNLLGIMLSGF